MNDKTATAENQKAKTIVLDDIAAFKRIGAFSGKPDKHTITYRGEQMDIYIRPSMSYLAVMDITNAKDDAERGAIMIAASVTNSKGELLFSREDVEKLNADFAEALGSIVVEVQEGNEPKG